MQQTYIDAFVDMNRFVPNGKGSFPAWLSSLAKCNLVDAVRMLEADKRGGNHRRIEPRSRDESFTALHDLLEPDRSTPSRHAARDEACAALQWALQQLPDAYRQIVDLYDLKGQSVQEVARKLKRSPGAVFMIRARAHRRLREIMGRASHYLTRK
jgi:RNA polymerase sigma factor (sigma-70 family)